MSHIFLVSLEQGQFRGDRLARLARLGRLKDVFLDLDPSAAWRRGSAGSGHCTTPLRSDHLPRVGELARLRLVPEGILDRAQAQ